MSIIWNSHVYEHESDFIIVLEKNMLLSGKNERFKKEKCLKLKDTFKNSNDKMI